MKKVKNGKKGFLTAVVFVLTLCAVILVLPAWAVGAVKDKVVIGIATEPPTLDPQMTSALYTRQVCFNIYDNLVMKNYEGQYTPSLAESWTTDGTQYVFKLKKGIKFHNGDELKASDVRFTFERGMQSPHVRFFYDVFEKVEALDDFTIRITLKYPTLILLDILTLPQTGIVSERAVTEAGKTYGRKPVGTGPYSFDKWTTGVDISLKGNDDYFMGKPAIGGCEFRFISDKSTAMVALEKGEVDAYLEISAVDKENAAQHPRLKYEETAGTSYEHLLFNCEDEKFSNVKLRQAIAYALDKESILMAGNNGVGALADSQIPPFMFGYPDTVKSYPYDPQKAQTLLSEAGYEKGFECTIKVNSGFREKEAQVIQANLSEIGIDAKIEVLEWGTLLSILGEGKFQLSIVGKNLHFDDPAVATNNSFNSKYAGEGGNFYRYRNPELDVLLEQSITELDKEKRIVLFEKILKTLHGDVPNVPLYWNINNIAYVRDLEGVKVLPITHYKVFNFHWQK